MTNKNLQPVKRLFHMLMFNAPMMISCDEFETFVLEYLEDGLAPRQKTIFELHIKVCPECRAYLDEYKRALSFAEAQRNIEETEVPEELVKAILDAQKG